MEFVRDSYRHGKTLLALGEGADVLEAAGIAPAEDDGGLIIGEASQKVAAGFLKALARHRHPEREHTPPVV
ncbi:hypothetical protein A9G00_35775 [Achromobacter xylosoxidans]|nr:hypothetical protein A9G00_35775 [Achromobacter xylosoxidans]